MSDSEDGWLWWRISDDATSVNHQGVSSLLLKLDGNGHGQCIANDDRTRPITFSARSGSKNVLGYQFTMQTDPIEVEGTQSIYFQFPEEGSKFEWKYAGSSGAWQCVLIGNTPKSVGNLQNEDGRKPDTLEITDKRLKSHEIIGAMISITFGRLDL
ncbi:hypothetical protein C8R44DRAFT_886396 [Mycena epipterygia]|nr:hypothetical protein C8R44DRAFT_886396 [Mycena epipterygia]